MTIANRVVTDMEPSDKPYVAIYLREHVLMSAGEMAQARRELLSFAERNGYGIDEVALFVEKLETVPDAFARMAERLSGPGEHLVIIPGIHHLAGLGSPPLEVLEAFTADGVQVVMAAHVE